LLNTILGRGRTWLYDKGFTLDAQLTQIYQGVTSGGAKDNGNAQYNGLLEINSTLDTAKIDQPYTINEFRKEQDLDKK